MIYRYYYHALRYHVTQSINFLVNIMTLLFSFCSQTKLKQQYNNTTQENLLGALTNHVSVFRRYLIKTDLDTMQ